MSWEEQYDAMSDHNAEMRGEGSEEGIEEERERILKILHDFLPFSKYKRVKELIEE